MHARKPPSESVLRRAVEARAEGDSWEAVGRKVRRSPRTIRRWQQIYPERWAAAQRSANRAAIDYAAAESVLILRNMLRTTDDKLRIEAAWRLVYQRLELTKIELKAAENLSPEPPSDAHRIAAFVKDHTHEELCDLAAHMLRSRIPASLCTHAVSESSAA